MAETKFDNIVWELTSKCNLACKHCYNGVPYVRDNDLTLEEQLKICSQLKDINITKVQLSGGEILINDNWEVIAKELKSLGIRVSIITNGVLFSKQTLKKIEELDIRTVGFSLEGTKENNDYIRGNGTYDKVMSAIDIINSSKRDFLVSVNTAVNRKNIDDLPLLAKKLCDKKVKVWQVQLSVPDGNFSNHKDELMLYPSQIDDLIDIMYQIWQKYPINISLGDCVGHFNNKEIEIRSAYTQKYDIKVYTEGCQAGKHTFSIKANGDIVGCISLNRERYIEGNIKEKTITEIINSPYAFAWNNEIRSKEQLKGVCSICQFGNICKSGCPSLKYDDEYNIVENEYCSYNFALRNEISRINGLSDIQNLYTKSLSSYKSKQYQLSALYLNRLYSLGEHNSRVVHLLNIVNKAIGNSHLVGKYISEVKAEKP